MIEVFKTNVKRKSDAGKIIATLLQHFPSSKINFDLSDCDKILRVEGEQLLTEKIMILVKEKGYDCDILE